MTRRIQRISSKYPLRLLVILTLFTVRATAQPERRLREFAYSFQESIADRLLPDDDVVIVHRECDSVVETPAPTVTEIIGGAAVRADMVLVVDVSEVAGLLVESGKWVETRITGIVRDTFRSSNNRQFSRGSRVVVRLDGGELMIGKVLIKASSSGMVPVLAPHHSYLLILKSYDGILRPTYVPLEVTNGRLRYPWSDSGAPDQTKRMPLEGLTLNEVTEQVRRVPRLPN